MINAGGRTCKASLESLNDICQDSREDYNIYVEEMNHHASRGPDFGLPFQMLHKLRIDSTRKSKVHLENFSNQAVLIDRLNFCARE